MIPFTNPEIQLDLIRSHTAELRREAAEFRRARQAQRGGSRFRRLRREPPA